MKRLIGVASTAVAVLGLGGCVAFDGEVKGKQTQNGKSVQLKFALCNDNSPDACEEMQMARAQRGTEETKVLLAFRVPEGTKGPDKFSPTDVNGVKFKPSKSYSAQMNRKAPRKGGERWLGYISNSPMGGLPDRGEFKVELDLPGNPGNVFKYRPAVGYIDGAPIKKVQCNTVVTDEKTVGGDPGTVILCSDDPASEEDLEPSLKIQLD